MSDSSYFDGLASSSPVFDIWSFTEDCSDITTSNKVLEWTWDGKIKNDFVGVYNDVDVKFHQNYSGGTAVIRGTEPMSDNQYYWEVKMISPVYGTDIMVGVGTSDADISQVPDRFLSLLGMDKESWGLSYTGLFHHSGKSTAYAPTFGQGSVIGIHLDLWNGTLSYYKNRKHLGIATTGLKGKTLYAMASSTAARSGMRILRTCSFPSSLQFLCCLRLRELIPDDKNVLEVVNIPPGLQLFLENNLSWLLNQRCHEEMTYMRNPCDSTIKQCITDLPSFADVIHQEFHASNSSCMSSEDHNSGGQYVLISSSSCILNSLNRFQRTRSEPDMEDEDSSDESSNKRHRCSYNYAMGLSDPDSD